MQTDFSLKLRITREPSTVKTYSASLTTPKYIEARTTQLCAAKEIDPTIVPACVTAAEGSSTVELAWDANSNNTGTAILTIRSELVAISGGSMQASFGKEIHEVTQNQHLVSAGNSSLDLANRELKFQIEVLTSLGVSQNTYDRVAIVGAVIASLGTLLGAGVSLKSFQRRTRSGTQSMAR